jgi:hypothetical protein
VTILNALFVDEIKKHPDGRVDLLGLFEDIYLPQMPVTVENLQVFVDLELVEADKGKSHQIEMRLVNVTTQEPIQPPTRIKFALPPTAEFPRHTAQLDLALFEITFHAYGEYALELWADDTFARRLPLRVLPP